MEKIYRKLIEIELKLGFLNIPSSATENFPLEKTKIRFYDKNGVEYHFSYNPQYRRLTGLTNFYRNFFLEKGDLIILENCNTYFKIFATKQNIEKEDYNVEEKDTVDISGLSNQAKGDIVEDRIKELILLHGQGLLNVYKPVIDKDGVDLIVVKNGEFHPIFIQSKGRFKLQNKQLILTINQKTFTSHGSFFIIGAYFDKEKLELNDNLLLIPSKEIEMNAIKTSGGKFQLVASLNTTSNNKWTKFLVKKENLAEKLLETFEEMGNYR